MVFTIIFSLFACVPEIKSVEEERFIENPAFDYDQDGYTENQGDCDDRNPTVNPAEQEVCDGFDNDCNGVVDDNPEDIETYYRDADGDGFGNETESELACPADKSDGYIEEKERNGQVVFDCDDANAQIHPDSEEICDFIDNDCDQYVDEDGSNAPLWYLDDDGDGFGNFDHSIFACEDENQMGPQRYVSNFADCDDDNSQIYPNAEEFCNESDDNCNGLIDEPLAFDASIWYRDVDEDGFGDIRDFQPSCSQPEGYVLDFSDCDDQNPDVNPNGEELCNGVDDDCNQQTDEGVDDTAPIGSQTLYLDADGDGYGDPNTTLNQCGTALGYVNNSEDCDDGDSTLNPDTTWYQDSDGDGEGVAGVASVQCSQPTDYVRNNTDCNDADSLINTQDADADGFSSCDGDCDDSDVSANLSDADSDGQDSCSGDCDDNDSSIYLNATESCNSIDDDCDGSIDEEDAIDKTAFYEDADGDGFGDATSIEYTCPLNQPSGFVDNLDDCDDSLATVYPNAQEYCNQIDNNCNGGVDEGTGFNAPPNALTWFYDLDGDGYGNPNNTILACASVVGTVSNSDDCNDSRAASRPGAAEYCNELDDDCDGAVDEDAIDRYDYYLDADGDGHGDASTQVLECPDYSTGLPNPPPNTSEDGDDCDDANADISPSAAEQCTTNIDENCDGDTTFGVPTIALPSWYPDSDGDGYGNPSFVIQLCEQPLNYIDNADDCNDTDFYVHPEDQLVHASEFEDDGVTPFVHRERCNGKVDLCENSQDVDSQGYPVAQDDEWDDDGDGRVECTLDVDPLQWADLSAGIVGGDDCDDNDVFAYPDAPELCNGAFEDCNDPLYIAQSQSAPDDELDDDDDCFVECYGFDASIWEGGVHSCEHVDGVGQLVQETVVVGGEDCNDGNADTYVGAAYNDPTVCAQDANGDGEADCNLVGLVGLTTNYSCDFGVDLPNGGMGPDFVLIQGGLEPLERYTLTNDFYVMTTEVTQAMWTDVMATSDYGYSPYWSVSAGLGDLYPAHSTNWYDAIAFANALSVLTGREECYGNTDDPDVDFGQLYDPDDLDASFLTPYDCTGFRLLTEAEWEYAARSGTTSGFWTGQGSALGGTYSSNSNTGTETIVDGASNPLLRDYAWYGGNYNNQYGANVSKEVGQKLPNGFGLYDVHGNLWEWTADWWGCSFPLTSTDPHCNSTGSQRVVRGGHWNSYPTYIRTSYRTKNNTEHRSDGIGFRIVLPL